MSTAKKFLGLSLDDDALQTPQGSFPLRDLTRAEFVRDVVRDGTGRTTSEMSGTAVAGGALVGGALLGPVGAVGGALLGSNVRRDEEGLPHYTTRSVQLIFETADDSFAMDVEHSREGAAYEFAKDVQRAMKRAKRR